MRLRFIVRRPVIGLVVGAGLLTRIGFTVVGPRRVHVCHPLLLCLLLDRAQHVTVGVPKPGVADSSVTTASPKGPFRTFEGALYGSRQLNNAQYPS
jgi:hypothetical protein